MVNRWESSTPRRATVVVRARTLDMPAGLAPLPPPAVHPVRLAFVFARVLVLCDLPLVSISCCFRVAFDLLFKIAAVVVPFVLGLCLRLASCVYFRSPCLFGLPPSTVLLLFGLPSSSHFMRSPYILLRIRLTLALILVFAFVLPSSYPIPSSYRTSVLPYLGSTFGPTFGFL